VALTRTRVALRRAWRGFQQSILFFPILLVGASLLLFTGTALADRTFFQGFAGVRDLGVWQFLVFGGSPVAAESLLSTIASMWASITGVVFSVTLVALSLSATKYSAQVVPYFERDRLVQVVLGVYLATVVYALLVLKTVRTGETGEEYLPFLGTNVAILLAVGSLFLLVLFIQNIASYIRPKRFVAGLAGDVRKNVEVLLVPARTAGYEVARDNFPQAPPDSAPGWVHVRVREAGFLQAVDWEQLHGLLHDLLKREGAAVSPQGLGRYLKVHRRLGEHVGKGDAVVSLHAPGAAADQEAWDRLLLAFRLQDTRTVEGDPGYGVESLADISVTSMSGGTTDVGVALACVREQFGIARLAVQSPAPEARFKAQVGAVSLPVERRVEPLLETVLRHVRRTHDKALNEGYGEVLEEELMGLASLLEVCEREGAGDATARVLEWGGHLLDDVFSSLRDVETLERVTERFSRLLRDLQGTARERKVASGLHARLRGAIAKHKDAAAAERLLRLLPVFPP